MRTPAPWGIIDWESTYNLCTVVQKNKNEEGLLLKVAMYATKEDAEFICLAVNSHEALVERLKEARTIMGRVCGMMTKDIDEWIQDYNQTMEAISKASKE